MEGFTLAVKCSVLEEAHVTSAHDTVARTTHVTPPWSHGAQSCSMARRGDKLEHLVNSTNDHQNQTLVLQPPVSV